MPDTPDNLDDAKGRVKESVGDAANDQDLKDEGRKDQAEGKLKQAAEDAKDKVEDAIDSVRDKI